MYGRNGMKRNETGLMGRNGTTGTTGRTGRKGTNRTKLDERDEMGLKKKIKWEEENRQKEMINGTKTGAKPD